MGGTVVILGAGQAGAQVAQTLRELGHSDPIILVGDEPHLPYQRPPLSKAYLKGEIATERLSLLPAAFYVDRDIDVVSGSGAARIELAQRRVVLESGVEIAFDHLVVATGARARTPSIAGIGLDGVLSLRRVADVEHLRSRMDDVRRVAIIGGGYIGLEVAAVMREQGREVTIVEAEDRLLKRVCAMPIGRYFETLHREHGVAIATGVRVAGIRGDVRAGAVALAEGGTIEADLVLMAAGAVANTEIAAAAGIAVADGILVDVFGRTSVPDVYACGDCARFPSRRFGRSVRIESVHNAIEQARCVAATIAGSPRAYDPVPWFWSDQYRTKLQIVGLSDPTDGITTVGDARRGPLSVEYRRAGRLVAVDTIDSARAHMLARRRIADETADLTADAG